MPERGARAWQSRRPQSQTGVPSGAFSLCTGPDARQSVLAMRAIEKRTAKSLYRAKFCRAKFCRAFTELCRVPTAKPLFPVVHLEISKRSLQLVITTK
jgi:hypothetical protein